ncbi:hypothetical protein PSD17_05520 [Pseudonocardia sp. D17]|nr:hypothetical protein PSD17_05520 [Pseudonocardia sp. D17]
MAVFAGIPLVLSGLIAGVVVLVDRRRRRATGRPRPRDGEELSEPVLGHPDDLTPPGDGN